MGLFEDILAARGLSGKARNAFLNPSYDTRHDPFLLPDMKEAVERLIRALDNQEKVTIYGDYDIDGLTATTLLLDALSIFGFSSVEVFIPNRFVEGYGLNEDAVKRIAADGTNLIITVDCGSLSEKEIVIANSLGVDVVVTDHHNIAPVQPPAVAVINPKRFLADFPEEYENFILKPESKMSGKLYPFLDLAGVGVAFKLIQALQTKLEGLPDGQEKWFLDLVALGTVCDIVTLVDENRTNVFWGLKVLAKTHRPGLKALMAVSGVDVQTITTRSLGFALGPRMNAAGRLETAQIALDMLTTADNKVALQKAQQLDDLNRARRAEQDIILREAVEQAEERRGDSVLVVSGKGWNHGIVGIVAAKLLEKYSKPSFVLEEMGRETKGSARSYGDFSAADAIRAADEIITKGGGHKFAAGVSLPTKNIVAFRKRVNEHYESQKLSNQQNLLLPKADAVANLEHVTEDFLAQLTALEPFGNGNQQPVLMSENLSVVDVRRMGSEHQHVKLELQGLDGKRMHFLAFSAPQHFFVELGDTLNVWYQPGINEWKSRRSVEGRILHLERAS